MNKATEIIKKSTRNRMYGEKSNLMMDCRSNAGDLQTMEAYRY